MVRLTEETRNSMVLAISLKFDYKSHNHLFRMANS